MSGSNFRVFQQVFRAGRGVRQVPRGGVESSRCLGEKSSRCSEGEEESSRCLEERSLVDTVGGGGSSAIAQGRSLAGA